MCSSRKPDHHHRGKEIFGLRRHRPNLLMPSSILLAGLVTIAIAVVSITGAETGAPAARHLGKQSPAQTLQLHGRDPVTGHELRRADFAGRPVLVEFWAPACPVCREAATVLERFARAQPQTALLGIDVGDGASQAKVLAVRYRWRGPSIVDSRARLADTLALRSLPETLVLDRHGRIVARLNGPVETATLGRALRQAQLR